MRDEGMTTVGAVETNSAVTPQARARLNAHKATHVGGREVREIALRSLNLG